MGIQKKILSKIIGVSLVGALSFSTVVESDVITVKADNTVQCTLTYTNAGGVTDILGKKGDTYPASYTTENFTPINGETFATEISIPIDGTGHYYSATKEGKNTVLAYSLRPVGQVLSKDKTYITAKLPVMKNCTEESYVLRDASNGTTISGTTDGDGFVIVRQMMGDYSEADDQVLNKRDEAPAGLGVIVECHMHYSLNYKYDDSNHWYVCDTDNVIFNKGAHTFDESGQCYCGYIKNSGTPNNNNNNNNSGNSENNNSQNTVPAPDGSAPNTPAPKGTSLKDSAGKETGYKVTDDSKDNPTVIYEGSVEDKSKDSINIPDTVQDASGNIYKVTEIKSDALKGNTSAKSITIGDNIEIIGDGAFEECSNLKTIKLGNNVKKIGARAFRKCKKLTSATLPASVEEIGAQAFDGDEKLKKLTINCANLKSIGKNAIRKIKSTATIKLKGTKKQKKSAAKKISKKKTGYKKNMKLKK